MKKALMLCMGTLSFVYVADTGCTLAGGDIVLPDISSFSIQHISTFVPGDSATVVIYSSSLNAGAYLVHYNLTGANVVKGATAVLNMNNDTGSFSTSVLANPGNTMLTITEITTSSDGSAYIAKDNTWTFTDSIGLMTATVNDTGLYRVLHVTATLTADTLLTIKGINWSPLTTITIRIPQYSVPTNYEIYGNAIYSTPAKTDTSAYGFMTISNNFTTISGTFSFTTTDSTKIRSGTFSCAAP